MLSTAHPFEARFKNRHADIKSRNEKIEKFIEKAELYIEKCNTLLQVVHSRYNIFKEFKIIADIPYGDIR